MNSTIFKYIAKLSGSDKKTLSQKALKTAEEVGELAKVVLPFDNAASTTHRFIARERILEEVADVMLCALSVAYDTGFTDDEISAMMMRKARYWDELQQRETKVSYPLPYEIHITVAAGSGGVDMDRFKTACVDAGVKPILLDLHNRSGNVVMMDSQTSGVHMGDNKSALAECERISTVMRQHGFHPLREKIETVPWHPAAPQGTHANPVMPKDSYFEAHLNIVVSEDNVGIVRDLVTKADGHLSRNAFKRISDTEYTLMATLRRYTGTHEEFKAEAEALKANLNQAGFDVPKVIVEFSIYDTKIAHDANWLEADHA
jgi:NTP pyrophosphatase (non-canonical NTP hydrolase)